MYEIVKETHVVDIFRHIEFRRSLFCFNKPRFVSFNAVPSALDGLEICWNRKHITHGCHRHLVNMTGKQIESRKFTALKS